MCLLKKKKSGGARRFGMQMGSLAPAPSEAQLNHESMTEGIVSVCVSYGPFRHWPHLQSALRAPRRILRLLLALNAALLIQ